MIVMGHKVDEWGLKVGPAGPEKLLEDSWFFGNNKMSSITSSDTSHDKKSYQQTYESIEKLSVNNPTTKGSIEVGRRRRRSQEASSKNSLPASTRVEGENEDEDEDEEEMEFSMGKLIRQASLNHSHTFPPKKQGVMTASSGKNPSVDRPQPLMSQKSLSALQCNELDLSNSSSNSAEVKREKVGERKLTRTQSWAPPVPVKWGASATATATGKTKRSKEDIKTQIKFWARAVASNVNPE